MLFKQGECPSHDLGSLVNSPASPAPEPTSNPLKVRRRRLMPRGSASGLSRLICADAGRAAPGPRGAGGGLGRSPERACEDLGAGRAGAFCVLCPPGLFASPHPGLNPPSRPGTPALPTRTPRPKLPDSRSTYRPKREQVVRPAPRDRPLPRHHVLDPSFLACPTGLSW